MSTYQKIVNWKKRKAHIRKNISGTSAKPRVSVYRSSNHIYVQIIDDESGKTLVSSSDVVLKPKKGQKPVDIAKEVGKDVAKKAIDAGIENVVFDRSGFKYHGRVKSLAESMREAGLKF